tara:strand:- start:82 stop:390 length:309 start_codon:yes stop_codon:yes gene_type:complete
MSIIGEALKSLRPGAAWSINANDLDQIVWYSDVIPPTKEEIEEEIIKLELEEKKIEYKKLRKLEYPAIEDQLDLLYHEGIEGWKKIIKDVKDKYPKPEAPSE